MHVHILLSNFDGELSRNFPNNLLARQSHPEHIIQYLCGLVNTGGVFFGRSDSTAATGQIRRQTDGLIFAIFTFTYAVCRKCFRYVLYVGSGFS